MSGYGDPTNQVGFDGLDPPPRKRRRAALSCFDCKRRKVKCDRGYPACSRCQKGGHANICTYETAPSELAPGESLLGLNEKADTLQNPENLDPLASRRTLPQHTRLDPIPGAPLADSSGGNLSTFQTPADRIRQLENRIVGLESAMTRNHGAPVHSKLTWDHNGSHPLLSPGNFSTSSTLQEIEWREPVDLALMHFRGKKFKTQFYGASHPISLISRSLEVGLFMKETFTRYPALGRVRVALEAMKKRTKAQRPEPKIDRESLLSLIPNRELVDRLVRLYLDTFERTYRILHVPTFRRDYHDFWENPQQSSPFFLVILLLVLAVVRCFHGQSPPVFVGESSQEREIATTWIEVADAWIEAQSQKRTTLAFFQIHCLSYLAKRTNEVKKKRWWTLAGTLLRRGLAAGLHREAPFMHEKTSAFIIEMRRRIWYTIAELELQASVSRGMPAALTQILCDCNPPLNINDDDLEETAKDFPASKPASEYTDTAFQHVGQQSLALRLELTSFINGPNARLTYEELLAYDGRIMQALSAIPKWSGEIASDGGNPTAALLPHVLLELQLRQYLFWLHRPFAQRAQQDPKYSYSRIVYMDNAIVVLKQHLKVAASGCQALSLLRDDEIFHAILSICHEITVPDPIHGTGLSGQVLVQQAYEVASKTLGLLEDNVLLLGQGFKSFFFLSVAYSWAQTKISPELSKGTEPEGPERALRLYDKIMVFKQPENPSGMVDLGVNELASQAPRPETIAREGDFTQQTLQQPLDQSYVFPDSFETALLPADGFDSSALPELDLDFFWNLN